jgi:hypothetical protein
MHVLLFTKKKSVKDPESLHLINLTQENQDGTDWI